MRSATTRPPLASRFARIRPASTSRPVTASAAAAAAPPANASAPERLPLRVPAAHRPLVLVGEPAEQDSRMGVREACACDRERRADRIALLRHRRRPSARRLGNSPTSREEDDVATDLRGRARDCVQRRAELRDALAVRVPRKQGLRESELLRVETDDLERLVSEGGERARGPAELRREPLRRRDASGVRAPRAPTRASLPPSARRSWAPPAGGGCARPWSRAVGMRAGTAVGESGELREHELGGTTADEHRGRVHDVLARRAQMDVGGGLVPDRRGARGRAAPAGFPAGRPSSARRAGS